MKEFKILSIDAWASGEETSWEWNAWYNVGNFDGNIDDNKAIIPWFVEQGLLKSKALQECEIEDDQYNLVIVNKETREPIYAIEYGNQF